ncbi:MAG: 1,4-alpha-glucan branching protein GlgB [Chlamydiota bacterium]
MLVRFEEMLRNPHAYLGLHMAEGRKVIRLWRPGAVAVYIELSGEIIKAKLIDAVGMFEVEVSEKIQPLDYKVYHLNGLLAYDPYAFWPTFGALDAHLFGAGVHYKIYEVLGAHPTFHQGCQGIKFAVWAPSAQAVSLIGDFNAWDGRINPMRSMGPSGVWEIFIPGLSLGERYKFEIRTHEGHLRVKADPYANFSEQRPANASIVVDVDRYAWNDTAWMEKRHHVNSLERPLNIYEVHLGSWKSPQGGFMNYRDIAHDLAAYCLEMGFTHVELMPVVEHPLDESWGYQVTGFYAITSRYGTLEDFQYFVDHFHSQGLGVILDWVPAHFPRDEFSLAQFDGTYLYEHADPRQGFHPHWNTYIFNYGRKEVSNFLIGSALFLMEKVHIDGLRVDAVASMLYLDYGRKEGEWIPNAYGRHENLEAIEFIKHLNSVVHEKFPGVLMCAEESTSFVGVTHPLDWGGLGFDLKWNMGWMNDTLRYFHKDPLFRTFHHNDLTFGLLYAYSEKFLLVLSHDEVVHGKASLLSKMPGDIWQKFANLRLLYSYMICQPGKKLIFMGCEIGQWNEWNCKGEIEWSLLQFPLHSGMQRCVAELNRVYQNHSALWKHDFDSSGFRWIDFSDKENCVISYLRTSDDSHLVCVHNFTPRFFSEYFVQLERVQNVHEVFNTDKEEFGGGGKINKQIDKITSKGFNIELSPLATMIFEVHFER